jgi:hypothetical protein
LNYLLSLIPDDKKPMVYALYRQLQVRATLTYCFLVCCFFVDVH